LASVLYGGKDTDFVALLSNEDKEVPRFDHDRLVTAIESISSKEDVAEILKHIKAMDEEGVLIVTGAGKVDEESDKGKKLKNA